MAGEGTTALDQLLRQRLSGRKVRADRRIGRVPRGEPLPLSFGQRSLWLVDQLEPGSVDYLLPGGLRLRGPLAVEKWSRAWNDVLRRHEILRTRYESRGGQPVQIIDPAVAAGLSIVDFSGAPDPERRAVDFAEEQSTRPFALDRDHPVRAWLIELGPEHHIFFVVLHHIAFDGWSLRVLTRDLCACYRADGLAPLAVQYADYASWQRDQLADRLAGELGYWRDQLADLSTLALPTDRPRPVSRSRAGDSVGRVIPAPLVTQLRELARQHDCTLFTAMHAILTVLLARHSGQRDICVGTPIAGRDEPEVADLVGFFVNTVVLRCRWESDPSFEDLLVLARTAVTDALANQHVPFEQLVDRLQPDRDLSSNPLFQVSISMRGANPGDRRLPGLTASRWMLPTRTVKFDLSLMMDERPNGELVCEFEYATALFDRDTVERLSTHLMNLLTGAVANPTLTLSQLPLMSSAERSAVLVNGLGTADQTVTASEGEWLPALFERHAARTPDATALVYGDTRLRYDELNVRANQIAHQLRALGAGPEVVVGVCLDRSVDLVATLLGVVKAGAAYVPLDPVNPVERLRFIAEDSALSVVVTTSAHTHRVAGVHHGRTLVLDQRSDELAARPGTNPDVPLDGDNLCYLIYTSGSTGRPKGVGVTYRNVVRLFSALRDQVSPDQTDVWTMFHSYAFDFSVWELWGALLHGGTVVVVPLDVARSPHELVDLLAREEVTILSQTPSAFRGLVTLAQDADPRLDRLALRAIVLGGERLEPSELLPWTRRFGLNTPVLVNMYGITETTVHVTAHRIGDQDLEQAGSPVGRPIADLVVRVLDEHGNLAPIGVWGEIHVGGAGLARGYLGRSALTAERFVPDPWGAPGGRLYRSGDLARWLADGGLEYRGRIDDQVKIRGYRIELGEVEAAIAGQPEIAAAAAVVREDRSGHRRIVGYGVARPGQSVEPRELLDQLARLLPPYMLPSDFVLVDAFPLTSNGKLDLAGLPEPEAARSGPARRPGSPAEEVLCRVIAEVVGSGTGIDPDANFFSVGGDSISALQLVSRARAAGLDFTARDVFEHKTAAALATIAVPSSARPIRDLDTPIGELPLTPVMRWTLEHGGPITHHHQAVLVHAPVDLDETRLVTTLQALVDHHDALRMRLRSESLYVDPVGAVDMRNCCQRVDVGALDPTARRKLYAVQAAAAANRLDPSAGVMVQVVWFDGRPGQAGHLLLALHHLVVDSVSWRILLADLAAAYPTVAAGRRPVLEPVGASYRGWVRSLLDEATRPARIAELPLWQGILNEPEPHFGRRAFDPALDVQRSAHVVRVSLPADVSRLLLTALPAAFHANVDDVLLAGLVLGFREWRRAAGHPDHDVLVDVERHGRHGWRRDSAGDGDGAELDLSRTVGWFTAIHPVRLGVPPTDWTDARDLASAVKQVKDALHAIPDKGVGYGLLRYLNPDTAAELAGLPAPQLAFNYLGRFSAPDPAVAAWTPAPEGDGLRGGGDPDMPFAHALEIGAYAEDGRTGPRLVLTAAWPADLFAETEIRELVDRWSAALTALTRPLDRPDYGGHTAADFPLVSVTQRCVDELERAHSSIMDIWPLGPLQHGLLFHALYGRFSPEVYTVQLAFDLPRWLPATTFRAAVGTLLARHPNLRVGMWFAGLAAPVQFVPAAADPPWAEIDLTEADDHALAEFMAADRTRRFDMTEPPLVRLTGIRLGAGRYRVVWTCHHLLLDGWSLPLLATELLALCRPVADAVPAAPARYRDYLTWLVGRNRDAAQLAWADYLADLPEPARLVAPGWNRTPARVADVSFELGAELTGELKRFGAERSLTMNTIVQGAWGLVVAWLAGQRDVVFGNTVAGRPPEVEGIESMIGFFLNVVPVRVHVRDAVPVADMLTRIQREQSALIDHHHLDLVGIQRIAGRTELFDSVIVFENFPVAAEAITAGAEFAGYECHHSLHFPLALVVYPDPGTGMQLRYRPDLFSGEQVAGIARLLRTVLDRIAADPGQAMRQIITTTPGQRQELVQDGVGASRDTSDRLLPELFEEQAARTPHRIAVCCGAERFTYVDLNERANQLAHRLISRGAGPERRVALCLPRSADLVVAMLAVLKTGAAYLPVDPRYPERYRHQLLADGRPAVVLTEQDLADESHASSANPVVPLDPAHPAYVLYTSGSTGQPKGVVVEHAALVDFCRWFVAEMGADLSHVIAATSVSFDVSVMEILPALLAGGTVELVADLRSLAATSAESRPVGLVSGVPSAFDALSRGRSGFSATTVVCAGEPLRAETANRVVRFFGAREVLNLYGPTEATVCATRWRSADTRSVSIGRPRWNTTVYVLNTELEPVPPGVPGELYVAGAGLARGYLGRPDLTAERFLPDPCGPPGGRMYRTGDLARWRADGQLEFLGRLDDQVKIRGFRVEPAQVETVLSEYPGVTGVAVTAHQDGNGEAQLIAYVVGLERAAQNEILPHCRRALPEHLVPAAVIPLDALPLTDNGKLNRRALPQPVLPAPNSRRPETATESYLAGVFASILDVPSVGVHDSFVELGGHSLRVLRLAGQLRADHGIDVDLAELTANPTVADLASIVEARQGTGAA